MEKAWIPVEGGHKLSEGLLVRLLAALENTTDSFRMAEAIGNAPCSDSAQRSLPGMALDGNIFLIAQREDCRPVDPQLLAAQALLESREELRRLSGLLVSIQEDERRRIAVDLHDGLGQSISLIKLSIEKSARLLAAGATSEAGESLRQLLPRVDEALVDVRRVSTELRPLMIDDLGILPTLSWFFREFDTACGGIVVERAFNVAECDVPVPLHITLYRILQEAFHNIVKHSAADRVHVGLERIDDALHLVIEDNGRGFDPDTVKCVEGQTRGLGLISMKERASFSGGTYSLSSVPGKGTRIEVSWPSGGCPASVDCCRAFESNGKQSACQAKSATRDDGPKNTVNSV